MTSLKESVQKKIEQEHIAPRSRTVILTRRSLLWCGSGVIIILTAMAAGVMFEDLFGIEAEVVNRVALHPLHALWLVLPIIWIALFSLGAIGSYILVSRLPHSYRRTRAVIVLSLILLPIGLGLILTASHTARSFEMYLRGHVPPYKAVQQLHEGRFEHLEEGVIGGVLDDNPYDGGFVLITIKGKRQQVVVKEHVSIPPRLSRGKRVYVIGKAEEGVMMADQILPWRRIGPGVHPDEDDHTWLRNGYDIPQGENERNQ